MPTELYDPANVFAAAFKWDADLQWSEVHEYDVAKRKVESVGTVNEYIADKPMIATVDGKVTAMTVEPDLPNPNKLISMRDDLVALAAKKAKVLVISELYAGEMVIQRAEIGKGISDGVSFVAKVTLTEITETTVGTVQVPASRLRAKVKKRMGSKSGGSGAGGSKPVQSHLAALDDLSNGAISGIFR